MTLSSLGNKRIVIPMDNNNNNNNCRQAKHPKILNTLDDYRQWQFCAHIINAFDEVAQDALETYPGFDVHSCLALSASEIPASFVEANNGCYYADIILSYTLGVPVTDAHQGMASIFPQWGDMKILLNAIGSQAVVIELRPDGPQKEARVVKISPDLKEEGRLWSKLSGSRKLLHPSFASSQSLDCLIYDVQGFNLAVYWPEVLEEDHAGIIRQIFEQLYELNSFGVYHRDIRPDNVLLVNSPDDEFKKAYVIDLGIASDDPDAVPMHNRRYGGSDLLSFGQLVYMMKTGHNLFNEFGKQSLEAADGIAKLRQRFCDDAGFRVQYLHKVDRDVSDAFLAKCIEACLMAGLRLGEKPLSCPEEMRDAAYAEVRQYFEGAR